MLEYVRLTLGFECAKAAKPIGLGGLFRLYQEVLMETKLYVGNLSYSTTEEDLQTLFSQAGTVVSVTLIKDRDSGRSKGFAFVEMESQSDVEKAIQTFDGYAMDDREIRVSIARPREERPSGGYDRGRRSYGDGNRGGPGRDRRRGGQRRY
jgi:RNA recognition motif-containing protein